MTQTPIALTVAFLFGAVGITNAWQAPLPAPADAAPAAIASATAERDAMAATVIEAMRQRFDGADVEFKFGAFRSEQGSLRDLALSGAGQVRLAGGQAWMPVRYSALFDTLTGEIVSPQVEFDTRQATRAATSVDAASLDAAVDGQLAVEFASQAIEFELADLKLVSQDARYVLVAGAGEAEFAGEGSADVAVQALYDRRAHAWLDVRYTLG